MQLELLILSRESGWGGGVVNLVSSIKSSFSENTRADDLIIGCRMDGGVVSRYLQPIYDGWRLIKKLRRKHFDVVHINPSLNINSLLRDGVFMLILRITGHRVLVFFHGWDEALSSRIRASALCRWLMRVTYGSSARILVLAGGFREQLVQMGLEREKIFTITTMFDGSQLKDVRSLARTPGRTLLFLSRFVYEKGIFELLEAFARITSEFPDVRMIMAGDGPVRAQLEQAICQKGLQSLIELPGYLHGKEKAAVLRDSDIFVLPSYGEGCPVSMLEAMAAGLAVISTSVGGIPDILHDGKNGALLLSPDPDHIYDALHNLLSSPEALAAISATNREVAWRSYESGIVTAELEKHYSECGRKS